MSNSLPPHPNLEYLRNEAKAIRKAHQRGDPAVCDTLRHLTRLNDASDEKILATTVSLQEIQHALANSYGFKNWKALLDFVNSQNEFAKLVQDATSVFTSKGPDHDSTRSSWEQRLQQEREKLLKSGETGFQVMFELAKSENGRARNAAAIFFDLSDDPRSPAVLRSMFDDPAASVRSRAVRFYASRIHTSRTAEHLPHYNDPADSIPDNIEAIFPMVHDENTKVQMDTVASLSAYAHLGDKRIEEVLHQALADPTHKVQHAAARALKINCPGCGTSFQAS